MNKDHVVGSTRHQRSINKIMSFDQQDQKVFDPINTDESARDNTAPSWILTCHLNLPHKIVSAAA
jgi:hypothetical protein